MNKKNNPNLVQELIDGRWTMDDAEFERKYLSLSVDDKYTVTQAIDDMENELYQFENEYMYDDET